MTQIMNETANIQEYKLDKTAIIAIENVDNL